MNAVDSSPGANDNASGMAGVLEAARAITSSGHRFPASIAFAGLSGEEQVSTGASGWRRSPARKGGGSSGPQQRHDRKHRGRRRHDRRHDRARLLGEPARGHDRRRPASLALLRRRSRRSVAPARALRRPDRGPVPPDLDVLMIYRLDRFGRGGHHRPLQRRGLSRGSDHGDARELHPPASGRADRGRDRVRRRDRGRRLRLRGQATGSIRRRPRVAGVGARGARLGHDRRRGRAGGEARVVSGSRRGRLQGLLARDDFADVGPLDLGGQRHHRGRR